MFAEIAEIKIAFQTLCERVCGEDDHENCAIVLGSISRFDFGRGQAPTKPVLDTSWASRGFSGMLRFGHVWSRMVTFHPVCFGHGWSRFGHFLVTQMFGHAFWSRIVTFGHSHLVADPSDQNMVLVTVGHFRLIAGSSDQTFWS